MKRNKKAVRIQTIQQAAGKNGLPGNLIVNKKGDVKPENWFSSREFRNQLLGAGLSPVVPVIAFKGATLNFEELVIEAEDVAAGPCKVTVNGREIEYKQAGLHNINLELNIDTMSAEAVDIVLDKSMKYSRRNQSSFGTNAPATTTEVEVIEDAEVIAPDGETAEEKLLKAQPKADNLTPPLHEELTEEVGEPA